MLKVVVQAASLMGSDVNERYVLQLMFTATHMPNSSLELHSTLYGTRFWMQRLEESTCFFLAIIDSCYEVRRKNIKAT